MSWLLLASLATFRSAQFGLPAHRRWKVAHAHNVDLTFQTDLQLVAPLQLLFDLPDLESLDIRQEFMA
ncbi:hypothetical protein WJX72_004062 [[Myrmecia] bisecta]|uniref:Uncharacterized protein n=1 Tax=[Myrmecia] bisecta TaxID=41462 RepID=A0AAW1PHC0_9CHLO